MTPKPPDGELVARARALAERIREEARYRACWDDANTVDELAAYVEALERAHQSLMRAHCGTD